MQLVDMQEVVTEAVAEAVAEVVREAVIGNVVEVMKGTHLDVTDIHLDMKDIHLDVIGNVVEVEVVVVIKIGNVKLIN
jgi:hypothetical protein